MKIKFLLKEYDTEDLLCDDGAILEEIVGDYAGRDSIIEEVICDVCKDSIDTNSYDLWENAREIKPYCEKVIEEKLYNTFIVDMLDIFEKAEFLYLEEQCYNNLNIIIYNCGINYLEEQYEDAIDCSCKDLMEVITHIINENLLKDILKDVDKYSRFSDINEVISDYISDIIVEME